MFVKCIPCIFLLYISVVSSEEGLEVVKRQFCDSFALTSFHCNAILGADGQCTSLVLLQSFRLLWSNFHFCPGACLLWGLWDRAFLYWWLGWLEERKQLERIQCKVRTSPGAGTLKRVCREKNGNWEGLLARKGVGRVDYQNLGEPRLRASAVWPFTQVHCHGGHCCSLVSILSLRCPGLRQQPLIPRCRCLDLPRILCLSWHTVYAFFLFPHI